MTQSKPSWEPSWNLGRLVQTLDFFDSIPVMSDIKKLFFNSPNPATPKLQDGIIFDFPSLRLNSLRFGERLTTSLWEE